MIMIDGLKSLRTNLVAAGAMMVASAAIFVSPAIAADYVGTAEDLAELQQVLAQYANALDGDDPEAYAAAFTENGVWHSGVGDRYRCIVGRAAIADLARGETQRTSAPGQSPRSHMTVLGKVTFVDKDHAHSHQTNILIGSQGFVQALKAGAGLFYTGYYNDTFERVNGRWLISNRDEFSGYNPATGLHDLKYHPPRTCPPDTARPAASATTSAARSRPTGYVGTADDLTQLQQLLAQYANSLDGDDPEGYAAAFTENGVWHSGIGDRYRCIVGHAAIADLARGETQRTSAPGQSPRSHMTLLGKVTFVDKDHAYSHQPNILVGSQGFVQALKGGADIFYTGYYNDTFERVNGRWLISNRDEFSGYNPATGLHDLKYHPPRTCPANNPPPPARQN
jgi:SnoaL-like domain